MGLLLGQIDFSFSEIGVWFLQKFGLLGFSFRGIDGYGG